MDEFRDLMYDLILESLTDKLENYEITMEDAQIISEAAYDEIYTEMSNDTKIALATSAVTIASTVGLIALASKMQDKARRRNYKNKDLVPALDNSIATLKSLKADLKAAKSSGDKEEINRIKQEIAKESRNLDYIRQEMDDNVNDSLAKRNAASGITYAYRLN